MKCPACSADNPDAARFCQVCGRRVVPDFVNQQIPQPRIAESLPRQPPFQKDAKKAGLVLAILEILAGATAIELSSLVIHDLHGRSSEDVDHFESLLVTGFIVAAVGVGMLVYYMLPKPEECIPLLRQSGSSTSLLSAYGVPPSGQRPGRRLGTAVRAILYLVSVLSPVVAAIAGAILYTRNDTDYRHVGRICLLLAAVLLIAVMVVVTLLYFSFGVPNSNG